MSLDPQTAPSLSFKDSLFEALNYFKKFCFSPVESIRHSPNWHWNVLISMVFIVAVPFGALGGIVKLRLGATLTGAIVFPIATLIVVGSLSGLIYYTALFLFHTKLELKKVAILSFLSCLPWVVVGPLVDYVPPLKPIAVLMCGFLAIVGFTENTKLTKKDMTRLVYTVVSIFVIFWVVNMIRNYKGSPNKEKLIDQQTLDILQNEMQKDQPAE